MCPTCVAFQWLASVLDQGLQFQFLKSCVLIRICFYFAKLRSERRIYSETTWQQQCCFPRLLTPCCLESSPVPWGCAFWSSAWEARTLVTTLSPSRAVSTRWTKWEESWKKNSKSSRTFCPLLFFSLIYFPLKTPWGASCLCPGTIATFSEESQYAEECYLLKVSPLHSFLRVS